LHASQSTRQGRKWAGSGRVFRYTAGYLSRHSGARRRREPGIHNQEESKAASLSKCGSYGFRARRFRAVPE
jgi:hypothetical protein